MVYNYWSITIGTGPAMSLMDCPNTVGLVLPGPDLRLDKLPCCPVALFSFLFPSILSLIGERFSFGQWRMVVLTVVANLDVRFNNFFLSLATIVVVVVYLYLYLSHTCV